MRLIFWLPDLLLPPPLRLMDLSVAGYHLGLAINALADLGVADALKNGPLSAKEIAAEIGTPNFVFLDNVVLSLELHRKNSPLSTNLRRGFRRDAAGERGRSGVRERGRETWRAGGREGWGR